MRDAARVAQLAVDNQIGASTARNPQRPLTTYKII
jgi:hypothetical protein